MKPITVAILALVLVATAWWFIDTTSTFLVFSETEFEIGQQVDLWGPDIHNGRYEITGTEPDPSGFRIYGRRLGPIPWAETCTVSPAINGEGFTVRYEDEGRSYYIWTSHTPKGD